MPLAAGQFQVAVGNTVPPEIQLRPRAGRYEAKLHRRSKTRLRCRRRANRHRGSNLTQNHGGSTARDESSSRER